MSLIGLILLILLFYFIIIPLVKAIYSGWQIHSQWKKATEGMRNAYRQAQDYARNAAQPKPKKKKIDPNVGEYVAFEDIACNVKSTDSQGNTTRTTYTESQVEDAQWEDIK